MPDRHLLFSVAAPRGPVFNFLADIENLPAWAGGFCEWIELHRSGWWAYTLLGELQAEARADDPSGEVELGLGHVAGWKLVLHLRVRADGDGRSLVSLSYPELAGPDPAREETLFAALEAGLPNLAAKIRPIKAVA